MKTLLLAVLMLFQGVITYSLVMDPGPAPKTVLAKAFTPTDIKNQIEREEKQKQYDQAEEVAARVMKRHGCDDEFAELVGRTAVDERISARLVAAVMVLESTCKPGAVSPSDGVGLMQVVPRMWHVSKKALKDPAFNVRFATHRILAPFVHAYGIREGLHHYNGLGVGCSACSDDYPERVMRIAGYAT